MFLVHFIQAIVPVIVASYDAGYYWFNQDAFRTYVESWAMTKA
jgi:hypothetical protein